MLKRIKELLGRRGKSTIQAAPATEPVPLDASDVPAGEHPAPPVHVGPKVVHQPIPESDLDPDAVKIVRRLTRFDHSAYLVGGCVRDLLLERQPKDFDIGTSATPRQVRRAFRNCRIIGRRFRLAHIYFQDGKIIEVATFRGQNDDTEGGEDLLITDDNRFGTLEEDALRRDFTINSLFYDVNNETVLDHADGLGDLRRRLVRTIGDPEVRFREDPIRILRAIKFAARLDFRIERRTSEAIEATRSEIPKAAAPRILEEINRFCRGGAARRSFELLRELSVLDVILPEIADSYARNEPGWELLLALMAGVDRRLAESGDEVATGTILAALLLPTLTDTLGWQPKGNAETPKGLKVRELADETLRPLALRLRVARKDQEACRQILMTLHRLVPVRSMRRNARQGLLRRNSLPSALFVLEVLGDRWGGAFAEAWKHWSAAAAERGAEPAVSEERPQPAPREADDEGAPRRGRRRSRRRGGSSSRRTDETSTERPRTEGRSKADGRGKPEGRPKRDGRAAPGAARTPRPAVWDDDYFFSALPSVPEGMEVRDGGGDRYGADRVDVREDAPADVPAPAETEGAPPRPRRRRRRRRRPSDKESSDTRPKDDSGND